MLPSEQIASVLFSRGTWRDIYCTRFLPLPFPAIYAFNTHFLRPELLSSGLGLFAFGIDFSVLRQSKNKEARSLAPGQERAFQSCRIAVNFHRNLHRLLAVSNGFGSSLKNGNALLCFLAH